MLNFIEYISWVYADQEPESYFQFVRKQKSKDIEKYSDSIYGFEFEEFYYSQLFTVHPFSYSTNFLDYHFGKYTGNKFDFLNFVKWSFFILGKLKFELLEKYNETSQNTINKDVVFEWIDGKKKELEKTEPTPPDPKKRKSPELNQFNKPVLTQKQTAILFKVFKDKNLFVINGLRQNRYEEIISVLTGYSKNTFHQDFSAKDIISISDKSEDYQRIIVQLQGIIEDLENVLK